MAASASDWRRTGSNVSSVETFRCFGGEPVENCAMDMDVVFLQHEAGGGELRVPDHA